MLFPFSFMQTTLVSTPVATAATGVGETSFTANWNAFAGASYYLLDVSTSSTFSSFVGSYQNFVVISNSQVVSGLTANTTYYYRLRAATGVDADAASFFSRVYTAGGALSYTEVSATETLVASLKANSLWTPMKAIYPMVGASAAACAQNLKSSSFTGTFTSGWTFASTGATPNGVSSYMDSGLNPNTILTLNNTHLSIYSRTQDITKSGIDFSALTNGPTRHFGLTAYYAALSTGISIQYLYPTNSATGYGSSTQGLFVGSRISSTDNKLYRNTTTLGTDTLLNTSTLPSTPLLLGANTGPTEFQNRQYAFASIGDGLTDTQASNLYTAVQAFQTTLGRAIAP